MLSYDDARTVVQASSQVEIVLPVYAGAPDDLAYLRDYVTAQATALYGVSASVFDQATIYSTSLLRDFVNRAIFQHASIPAFDALTDIVAPYTQDVAPLLRYPATGSCGLTALQMYHVFCAFGYDAVWLDSLNGEIGTGTASSYTDSHVVTLVRVDDVNDWIVQDAYLNCTLTDAAGTLLSYYEARQLEAVNPSSIELDGFTGFLHFRENGVGDSAPTASDEAAARNGLFGLPYAWQVGGSDSFTAGTSALFPDPANAHVQSAYQGQTFASAADASTAISQLKANGLSWQAAIVTLQNDHYATGFRLLNPETLAEVSQWVTLRLADGSYVSVDYSSGGLLIGSFDELQVEASGHGPAPNAGTSLADLLNPFILFGADGFYYSDWVGRPIYDANVAPELTPNSASLEPGTDLPLNGLFAEADPDGDLASLFQLVDADGPGVGNDFVKADGTMADQNGVIISRSELAEWVVRVGANPDSLSLTITPGDGAHWGAPIQIGGSAIQTTVDTGSEVWKSQTIYKDAAGQLIYSVLTYDAGGQLTTDSDIAGTQAWSSTQLRYDATGALEASRINYDAGGWLTTNYDLTGAQVWSSTQLRYDATGALEASRFDYDAGGWLATNYDLAGTQVWSSSQLRYDATGALEASRIDYDAGGWLTTNYDLAGTQVWSSAQNRYDDKGALEASRIDYDAGGWLTTNYDLAGTQIWSSAQNRYDDKGVLEASRFNYDAGGWFAVTYDTKAATNWTEHQQIFDPSGQESRELYRYDDLTSLLVTYDVAQEHDWTRMEQHYDASGVLLNTSYFPDTP